MKYLIILTFCLSYLLVNCAVSKCYEGNNLDFNSLNLTIKECDTYYHDFCAIVTSRNGEIPHRTCGDDEICIAKGCIDTTLCTKPGTYEHDYTGLSDVKFTVTCCDTDLCNVESSAKFFIKISFSSLFYMCVLVLFYLISI